MLLLVLDGLDHGVIAAMAHKNRAVRPVYARICEFAVDRACGKTARSPCSAQSRSYDCRSYEWRWERPMGYFIKGTNLIGTITLRRVSSVGAIKKAGELIVDGYREVQITAPDGRLFGHEDFNKLSSDSDRRLCAPTR
jgi:hypothetical protein